MEEIPILKKDIKNNIIEEKSINKNKKHREKEKGITLIALVVTIVILVILSATAITMIIGENGLFDQAKWGSFSSRFADVEEIRNIYEASKEMEEIQSQTKLKIEEKKGLTGEVSKEEKEEIEKNNKTLKIKMEELSGKPLEELKIYWIDNKKIGTQVKEKYVIDVETNQIYQYKGEKIYGKIWHTLDDGIGENDGTIEDEDKENFEGWIKLTLNYPENSTDWKWRLGAVGEVRNDPELIWKDYTGPIWVRIQDVENVWMRYKMNGEDVIVAPEGRVVVDIEADSYYPDLRQKVKVKINYDKGAEIKEYKVGNGEWKEYQGEFYVTENTLIEARAKKTERILNEFGEVESETESWGRDNLYIGNIGIEETELPAPRIIKKEGGTGEVAKVAIEYPQEAQGGKQIYKLDYGEEQEYNGEVGIEKNGTYVIAYYYNQEGKRSKSTSIKIIENGESQGGEYIPNKPGINGENGESNPTKPSYKIPGPVISENGGNVSISLPAQTTNKEAKENKIYYKILGQGGYKRYTASFKVEMTCTIASYYITEKGEISETTYKDVYIAEPGMPKVTIQLKPSEYEVKYNAGKVEVTIKAQDSEKIEYSFNKVEWKEYTKPIEVTKNCRIYARGTNSNGETIEYKDITNLGAQPEIPDTLSVNISTKDIQGQTGKVEKVKVSIGYDGRAQRKYYKIGQTGEIKEYTGAFEVDKNCTIYAYAISEKGYGEAQKGIDSIEKGIDSIEKGIMDPIITVKPNENYQASKVKVEIQYDKNVTQKKYRINKGQYKDYTESFEVEENCEIEAYSTNAKGEIGKSTYRITNIIKEDVITVIDQGDYYIIRLSYPPTAINKEYKWQEKGTWKPYHNTGILLAKEKIKQQVEGADVVKVKDEGGKEITFDKEDIYFITKPVNELIEQIYMRWDNRTPTMPEIILSTEEPCLELDATIKYSNTIIEKKYRIVYPNGVITSWKDYKDGEKIHVTQKGTTIYAKGQDETGMWTKTASRQINNIDEEPPVIKVEGDFDTETTQLGLKIGVTDDVGIEKIKWSEGNQLESYFKENGELLYEKEGETQKKVEKEIKVKANGYYTIYAEDIVGNSGIFTLQVGNIDLIPPKVSIDVKPEELTTQVKINIDYEDSKIKEYKIGNSGWNNYTGEITLSSYTVITNKWMNADGTVTIYAKGIDVAGNETNTEKTINNLDTQLPQMPVINSNYGYPILTEYGVKKDGKTTITFDTSKNVTNYYKIDEGQWIEYTGEFEIDKECTIYVKSVKNDSGLGVSTSRTITSPTDALGEAAYDGDENTGDEYTKEGSKYVYLDETMQGRNIRIKIYENYSAYVEFYSMTGQKISEFYINDNDNYATENIVAIPEGTKKIGIKSLAAGESIFKTIVYEIQVSNEPRFTSTKGYPLLHAEVDKQIKEPYEMVSINYFPTSVQRLYKIGDGKWIDYKDEAVWVNQGETIYAKGIDKFGNETRIISSYTANVSNALAKEAFDGDENTGDEYTKEGSKYVYVDETMQGRNIRIKIYENYSADVEFYSMTGQKISEFHINDNDNYATENIVAIPEGTKKIGIKSLAAGESIFKTIVYEIQHSN